MASLSRSDLDFVLQQILIAEEHAAGADIASLVPDAFAPFGLRTVDGTFNNLIDGQSNFGAADQPFAQRLTQVWRAAQDNPNIPGVTPTSYSQTGGSVYDAQPRVISNLTADQSQGNPAATRAADATSGAHLVTSPGLDGIFNTADDTQTWFIPNVSPDAGLSAPFNSWFTLFGQFFDHGLDLINKGGSGTVRILLNSDDPLYQKGADGVAGTQDDIGADLVQGTFDDPLPNFMSVSRASTVTDTQGTPDPADDIHYHVNQTTPFIDQNQTYTSHASHQVFLREYALNPGGHPVATGRLLDGGAGGLPTWADVKAQASTKLGIQLSDTDVLNVPLLRTDAYGKFLPGAHGFAQLIVGVGADGLPNTADDLVVEGDPTANGGLGIATSSALRTNHAFLEDIAHNAVPGSSFDPDGLGGPLGDTLVAADADTVAGNAIGTDFQGRKVAYDDELLDSHFITGDGRGNENIGLTAVHHIFHSEHNRQVAEIQTRILDDARASNDPTFLNQWLITDVSAGHIPADSSGLVWDGERLFQAARFATEMQYQHIVFEEFARRVQPNIDAFQAPIGYDVTINPAILSEFANVVYRFGHSMLTETVDRYDPAFNVIGNPNGMDPAGQQMGLIAAFLNPLAFNQDGMNADEAAGAIVRGMTRQVGNEIDEFVTEALRNNLVGLPLDLAAINIARGRDTGVPSLNDARREFFAATQDPQLKPYVSWTDFAAHLQHEASVINFIAAYGTHATITGASTFEDKRAAAEALVLGGAGTPADRLDFLNGPADTTGVDAIDFWIGGLAEARMPFGGLIGPTFGFVFETQLEALQNGDRFYYLARTAGLDFGIELENGSLAKLVMLNTDAGHLPASVFSTADLTLEVDAAKQFNANVANDPGPDGILFDNPATGTDESADNVATPREDPLGPDPLIPLVIRDNPQTPQSDTHYLRYTGAAHVVIGGTGGADTIISGSGHDTLYGDAGDDRLDGGDGNDNISGGDGNDIISDRGGDDVMHGDAGDDVIQGGNGLNLLFGDTGRDFIISGEDTSSVFAGADNDFVLGSLRNLGIIGGPGDDWLEFGHQAGTAGDAADPAGADLVKGHDVFVTGPGFDDIAAEGGNDIIFGSDGQEKMNGASGFDWADYKFAQTGVTIDLKFEVDLTTPATPSASSLLDLYAFVEGVSGSAFADVLRGDDLLSSGFGIAGAQGSVLDAAGIARIAGLQDVVGAGVSSFSGGNIILGGAGSDIVEGRGGDDIIDGDRWLDARISVRDADDHTVEIRSVDGVQSLAAEMLAGTLEPSQLEIVREIKVAAGGDYDTALYSGARANYTVNIAFDGTVTVRDNFGTFFGNEGTDTLRGIERLQFADMAIDLPGGPANAAPVGQLMLSDTTPAVGQTLAVSVSGITDADNAGGGITGRPITFYWQVERPGLGGAPGSYWEDITLATTLGGGETPAQGATFQLPALTAGLPIEGASIRVRAVYLDDHGVLENVFSSPSGAVAPRVVTAPGTPTPAESETDSAGVHLVRSDLQFILDQIVIAERHTAGEDLVTLVGNERLPYGLRTVDGTFNNLVHGQSEFGAADNNFPLLLDQVFRNDLDGDTFDANGPAPGGLVTNTNYATTSDVADADPRTISNLIADQTAGNPAALAAANANPSGGLTLSPGLDGIFGTADDRAVLEIPNVTPDAGQSAPFNAWMTLFGQFFDHGLDLVDKGGNGTIYMPLQADDPLIAGADGTFGTADDLPASQRFMLLTRAANTAVQAGADGVFGTADDVHYHNNETTPFIDQNQTYTSHPSHQAFLREYDRPADRTLDTGNLLEGRSGGLPTWADIKEQAADFLGIALTDLDIFDVPLLATDAYGNLILGPNGYAQVVTNHGLIEGVAGGLDLNHLAGGAVAARTGHAFLNDIAHNAVPGTVFDTDNNPATPGTSLVQPDADLDIGNAIATDFQGRRVAYDDELLDEHFITGDGRGNENIGLTAVHEIFHSEHNRLVAHIKDVALASNDVAFLNQWLRVDVVSMPADVDAVEWDGQRLFQAARFATEMQYQHLVFEEFARTVQPGIDAFAAGAYDTTLNPAIFAEFAHVVYRFGHSMLNETIDRYDPEFNIVDADPLHPAQDGSGHQLGLIAAFLNPLAFAESGGNPADAAGAIVRGMTRQVGNEIDEFVTEALRNNLVGLPLDLPAINIARGRDTGVPTLNDARAEFYSATGDAQLAPYTSWIDFATHLKHVESVINFIAAYGTHSTITSAVTLADKREAATALVLGGADAPADRLEFLNGPATTTGVNDIDLWIGGLAEKQMPFGGLLGSTFNFVFETQLEQLQDGDRFYYLSRTAGLNFLTELESSSFAKLIMANTDATHLPGAVFTTPTLILEVDQATQYNPGVLPGPDGIVLDDPLTPGNEAADNLPGSADPLGSGAILVPLVIRDNPDTVGPDTNYLHYTGTDHVVLGGTDPDNLANPSGDDILIAGDGADTLYGDDGNDYLEGGNENDILRGGPGNDFIVDGGGDDVIHGDEGDDAIQGGNGLNLIFGGFGSDFIVSGSDASTVSGGPGSDFILGNRANVQDMGNEGDDWLEHGNAGGSPGDNFDPFGRDQVIGNDVYIGDGGTDVMNAEGGDDIMVGNGGQQDHYIGASGFDWAVYKDSPDGVIVMAELLIENEATALGANLSSLDRFQSVEGISGSQFDDVLIGANQLAPFYETSGFTGSILTNLDLIAGLRELVNSFHPAATSFTGEILLGGAGSDLIKGGWGDEIIDGDAWLNVQIGVYDANDAAHAGAPISVHDSMTELQEAIFAGDLEIAQLGIVREIRYTLPDGNNTPTALTGYDTATFSGNAADYLVETLVTSNNGTPADASDDFASVVRVTNRVNGHIGFEGVDVVRNVERLEFSDTLVILNHNISNTAPADLLTVSDATPTEDQLLTVSIDGVTDADNVTLANPSGRIVGPVTYYWQSQSTGGVFADIMVNDGVLIHPATGTSFTATDLQVGFALRVRAVYTDANGIVETAFSAPTAPVIGVNDPHTGTVLITNPDPTQGQALVALAALNEPDQPVALPGAPMPPAIAFAYQWQRSLDLGATWADIAGASSAAYSPGPADVHKDFTNPNTILRVRVDYTDAQGFHEQAFSQPTTRIGAYLTGDASPNVLTAGTPYDDWIQGQGGNDTLRGLAGNDLLEGGSGDDVLKGGLGIDTAVFSGARSAYSIHTSGATTTVSGIDGVDTLTGIERLQFDDDSMSLSPVIVTSNVSPDANMDGRSDLLWRGPQGETSVWLMNGANIANGSGLGTPPLVWTIVDGQGDYNGDTRSDILWRGPNGDIVLWLFDGISVAQNAALPVLIPLDWTIADGHGDYNGDGKSDLLWRGPQGETSVWLMDGASIGAGNALPTIPLGWNIVNGHGDYNGDGKSDLLWRGPQGETSVWLMDGANIANGSGLGTPPLSWTIVDGQGDYNGDGKSDVLWRGPNGDIVVWLFDGITVTQNAALPVLIPLDWTIADGHGDYNGDGKSDILWRGPQGETSVWLMDGANIVNGSGLGAPPLTWHIVDGHGDYNGDGRSDVAWRGPNGDTVLWLFDGVNVTQNAALPVLIPLDWSVVGEHGATLVGNAGANTLFGTHAIDTLRGGAGADALRGNGAGDRFVFDAPLDGVSNVDTVQDFRPGEDKLVLSDVIFTNLPAGALSAGNFVSGANPVAQDGNDFVLYDTVSGQLSYDADASGPGAAVAFATLFGQPTLSSTDIVAGVV